MVNSFISVDVMDPQWHEMLISSTSCSIEISMIAELFPVPHRHLIQGAIICFGDEESL
jgi:hypothetical protein